MRYLGVIYFLSLLSVGQMSYAQPAKKELILRTKPLTEMQVYAIKNKLDGMPGVHFCGYQAHARCLMIQYDQSVCKKQENIIRNIRNAQHVGALKKVNGISIYEVLDGDLKHAQLEALVPQEE